MHEESKSKEEEKNNANEVVQCYDAPGNAHIEKSKQSDEANKVKQKNEVCPSEDEAMPGLKMLYVQVLKKVKCRFDWEGPWWVENVVYLFLRSLGIS